MSHAKSPFPIHETRKWIEERKDLNTKYTKYTKKCFRDRGNKSEFSRGILFWWMVISGLMEQNHHLWKD
jgi:hypothetical protein